MLKALCQTDTQRDRERERQRQTVLVLLHLNTSLPFSQRFLKIRGEHSQQGVVLRGKGGREVVQLRVQTPYLTITINNWHSSRQDCLSLPALVRPPSLSLSLSPAAAFSLCLIVYLWLLECVIKLQIFAHANWWHTCACTCVCVCVSV